MVSAISTVRAFPLQGTLPVSWEGSFSFQEVLVLPSLWFEGSSLLFPLRRQNFLYTWWLGNLSYINPYITQQSVTTPHSCKPVVTWFVDTEFTLLYLFITRPTEHFSAKKDSSKKGIPVRSTWAGTGWGIGKSQVSMGFPDVPVVGWEKGNWCGDCLEKSCQGAQGRIWWVFFLSSLTDRIALVCEDWIIFKPFLHWQKVCWSGYICMCLGTWVPE